MKPLCEIIVLDYLPVIRAMIAKGMMEKHGLSQKQAAEKLGISQPAISQYKKDLRGYKVDVIKSNQESISIIENMAKKLAFGEMTQEQASVEFCELCKHIRPNGGECSIPDIYENSK